MADAETEAEWEKSKRIEAERAKAAAAVEHEKPSRENLAYLDPSRTKVKGWSRDPNVMLASAERMGNRSIALAVGGAVLSFIGMAGDMVTVVGGLGMAGVIISTLPQALGFLCMGLAVLMAVIVLVLGVAQKVKYGRKLPASFWSAVGTLVVVGLAVLVRGWIVGL